MKLTESALAAVFLCTFAFSQEPQSIPVEIVDEPHHTLLLQNSAVRVFRLKLQSNEVTLPHRHKTFYVYVSLRPATIGNEVRGRKPVVTHMEAAELHTSKGGFTLAERNNSTDAAELLIIEVMKFAGEGFATTMGGFRYHDAAFGAIFEAPAIRGYTMTLAAGGRTEEHTENYDRVLLGVSDLKLRENVVGQLPSDVEMKPGEVRWIPRGITHTTSNIGTSPATFITLEFNQATAAN